MSISIKDAAGSSQALATGSGDGSGAPYKSPAAVGIGAVGDAAATDSTSSWSVVAVLKGLYALLAGTLTAAIKLGATAVSANSGTKDAGTIRVVLATDQPALTNKLLVTPDPNAAVNLAQVGGTNISQGHGTAAAAIRVELPTDGTGLVGANLAQALDATNDGIRAYVVVNRMVDSTGAVLTVKRKRVTVTSTSATSIVPAVTSKQILVLGYSLQSQGSNTPAFNFQDDAGTPVVLSRTWKLDATGAAGVNGVVRGESPAGCGVDPTTAGQALMGKMDATGSVPVEVTYVEL